ncbi:helix-turn-helix domain-containing protein [Myxococcus sp. AS-1-15]|uniref:helix-turn-helix domain-containing protein n=1 Tax=Myxococcus sp. AS-1-15 TaxID=2874600 RepID=UPI001CC06F1E|nr:helix-turn-helix domain-containing protein [Myxococcus sp. AS-1-15]MBZ4402004.1 helix-turn-helix domain-containing protein [Myxococcus sp. AS-1-15]
MVNCDDGGAKSGHLSVVRGSVSADDDARAWTVADVCAFLSVGKTWVYDRCAENLPGGLPFKRIGSRLRFDSVEVRAWWRSQGPEGQAQLSAALRERRAPRDARARSRKEREQ